MTLSSVYPKLPILLQHVACSLAGWRLQRTKYGAGFRRHLEQAEARSRWPEDRTVEYRDQQLQAFVSHCADTVPYYRDLFERHGIDPRRIRTPDDLKQIPVLTKDEVRRSYSQLISEAIPPRRRMVVNTSGSTGTALKLTTTLESIQREAAVWWRFRRWHGAQLDGWKASFGGRPVVPLGQTSPPFWRYNLPGKQILFSGYHISPENLSSYAAELRRRKPPWIHAYPSMLALLAAHLRETQSDLGYPLEAITVSSETLLPQQAELIESALGTRPRQQYGMVESVASFSECERGMLHVDEDIAATEFLANADDSAYQVVGTNFTNLAMPLLRYAPQDIVTLADGPCPCGRPGRLVKEVDGRMDDYVILRNGARLGRISRIVWGITNIREAQVRQEQLGQITICVVRGDGYTDADEKRLLQQTRQRVGQDMEVAIQYVPSLQRTRSGKLRFVVSELKEGQTAKRAE